MKLFCAPYDCIEAGVSDSHVPVALYSRVDDPDTVSIGAAVLERFRQQNFMLAPRAWDLLSISLSIIAADTAIVRDKSPDGWTRRLDMRIAVNDPSFWSSQKALLESQMQFLTTDVWTFEFVDGGITPPPPKDDPIKPDEDCICLLSGGLDSLIGAIDLSNDGKLPYLVSQVEKGSTAMQTFSADNIGSGLRRLELNHNVQLSWGNEISQRARSVIFLAYGVLLGTALSSYHDGDTVVLYMCENGFISINPPLTMTRLGSLSTKTTHPKFIKQYQQLLDQANLSVRIANPYQFKTKGEMMKQCADQAFLRDHGGDTISCAKYGRRHAHCGRCIPCLIRRAAFHECGIPDTTNYIYTDLFKDDSNHARYAEVRAAASAIAQARAEDFDRWIKPRLNSMSLFDISSHKDVVRRGLNELGCFLDAMGVR